MGKKDKAKTGQRKIGRNAKKPSHIRYNMEARWEANKKKRVAKQKKAEEKAKRKKELRK